MADNAAGRIGIEPETWFLVFSRRPLPGLLRWLPIGRFKHVLAIGWLPDQRQWIVYEVEIGRTRVAVLPACEAADLLLHDLRKDGVTVAFTPVGPRPRWARLGFWCVPAMAHLIGLKRFVLTPDALYRACLAQGGAIVAW